jgi:hypothetical protein
MFDMLAADVAFSDMTAAAMQVASPMNFIMTNTSGAKFATKLLFCAWE